MKLESISYTPKANVKFTQEEANLLVALSQVHYDGVCRDAGLPGGFLFGVGNYPQASLTFRQVDTIAKILEVLPPWSDKDLACCLRLAVVGALNLMQETVPEKVVDESSRKH